MITLYITAAMRLYLLHCSLATTPIDSAPALFVSSYHLCPQFTTYAVTESRALKLVPRRWRPGPWPLGGGAAKLSALASTASVVSAAISIVTTVAQDWKIVVKSACAWRLICCPAGARTPLLCRTSPSCTAIL